MKLKTYIQISILILVVPIVISGCGKDGDAVVVDFNQTIVVERSDSPIPELAAFNVAVAAMISPKETFGYYRQLLDYIGEKLVVEVQFIQRKTFWVKSTGCWESARLIWPLSVQVLMPPAKRMWTGTVCHPQVQKNRYYQSYLIVNKASNFKRLEDLRGRVFAFTDPESNTGKLVPTFWLFEIGAAARDLLQQNDLHLQP